MVWVLGFGLTALLLFAFPAARTVALWIVGGGAALIAYIILSDQAATRAAKSLIKTEEVGMRLTLRQDYGTWRISGELRNNSSHQLDGVALRVSAYDCPGKDWTSDCTAIGQEETTIYVTIPSKQVRAVDEGVYFSNMPSVRGNFVWSYVVTETNGSDPKP